MDKNTFSNLTGSLCYGGGKIVFTPGVTNLADGLQISLEYRQVTESAHHLLLRLKNTGSANTKQITLPKTLDLYIPAGEPVQYHSLTGDDCDEKSFMPVDVVLAAAYHSEPADGRSSSTTGFPFFDITADGCTAVMAIGWTGQWSLDIAPDDGGVTVQVGLCDADFYLLPGEEVRLPSVLIVMGEGVRNTRQVFRRVLMEYFSSTDRMNDGPALPVAIQCFDRYAQDRLLDSLYCDWPTEEGQIRTIEKAKQIGGIDTLWLDAAWFKDGFVNGGVGNYSYDVGFPNGLKPVADYAHKNGMKFVLWFEPERACIGTEMYPQLDKVMCWAGRPTERLYRLGDPAALAWLKEKLISLIRDNGVDIYRQDFGPHPIYYWRENDVPGRKGMTEIRHVMGMYSLWDTLLAEFPHLLIDNCAGGGRRLDLETVRRSVCLWRSDTGCSPERPDKRVSVWSQNQIMGLSEYIPFHSCATWDIDAYAVRSTATQGLACNFDIFNPDFDFAAARAALKEVWENRMYWNGNIYPLTEATTDESVWCAYQLDCNKNGIVYVFRREQAEADSMELRLNAVEEEAAYALTLVDEHYVERQLTCLGQKLREGLRVVIPEKRNSLLVRYTKI